LVTFFLAKKESDPAAQRTEALLCFALTGGSLASDHSRHGDPWTLLFCKYLLKPTPKKRCRRSIDEASLAVRPRHRNASPTILFMSLNAPAIEWSLYSIAAC